ncbi:MAG: ABC transporter substrate-binding protein [Chloroflexi bacterium]|nr:ABC transporter substrate-binding protein [Chloroflexota bacterium]MDP6665428.1 peptide ABC transporter substrate-binding protein [SAR202 cluster bacterium]
MRKIIFVLTALVSVAAVACSDGVEDPLAEEPRPTPEPVVTQAPASAAQAPVAPAAAPSQAAPSPTAPASTSAAPTLPGVAPQTQQAPASQPAASVEPSDGQVRGGIFRRLWADPPTLDPHLTTDTTSAGVVVEIFSGLVALNTDLQLVPDIAESWDISPDGTVYTFHLRPLAKFHDGKAITASDFKWSIERAASPDTASPVADTYLADIVGVSAVLEGDSTDISGIKIIDDHTLQIAVDAPKAYFLAKLTYPTAYVLDRDNVEAGGRNWTDSPNGTGPFRLKEYRIGERIILERNENYYKEPPFVDSVLMNLAGGQSMAMYENDEIDITGVGLFDLDRVLDPNEELNRELVVAPPDFSVSYVGFNTEMPPFDDANFRKALNHAVNKDLIATEVLSELVEAAYGVLPPGFPGYNPDLRGLRYDGDLARQLLADSMYSDEATRPRIVVTVPGTGGTIGLDLEVVIEMWKQELGVEVEIQQVEWATYLQDLNANKFQAFAGLGWEADYPDPQDFLDILFHTDSSINHGGYSNAEVDSVLEVARTEPDVVKRVGLYQEAEELIVNDAAWVPLWFTGERYVLIKEHVQDYRVTPMIIPKLKQVHFTD